MSIRAHVRKLRPVRESYTPHLQKVQTILSEAKLSKSELQKPAGKGPNAGIPRIEIFTKKITDGEDHMLNDGTTVKVKEITMNGEVYGVKDMKKLVDDFDDVDSISVTDPKISLSKFAKTPEYGGEGGGQKISTSTQELMTAALVLGKKKYDSTEISVDDAKKIIEDAKGKWSNIVGATGKETLLNQFTDNWYDLATAVSSANAILKIVPNPTKVFWIFTQEKKSNERRRPHTY